jgi:hypothetical protein
VNALILFFTTNSKTLLCFLKTKYYLKIKHKTFLKKIKIKSYAFFFNAKITSLHIKCNIRFHIEKMRSCSHIVDGL